MDQQRQRVRRHEVNLLLEIGSEEIPDWMLAGALEYLGSAVGDLLTKQRRRCAIRTDATPRRLVVRAEGHDRAAAGFEERVWGPAKSRRRRPSQASRRSRASTPVSSKFSRDGKAEKYSYVRKIAGRATREFWPKRCPQLF